MSTATKVKFLGFEGDFSYQDSKIFDLMRKRYSLEEVQQDPEVVIHSDNIEKCQLESYQKSRKLLIAAENHEPVDFEASFLLVKLQDLLRRLKLKGPLNFIGELELLEFKFRQIFPFYGKIPFLNRRRVPFRKTHTQYVKQITTAHQNNTYAIITNADTSPNILNFPYFMHDCLDNYQGLRNAVDKKKLGQKKFCAFLVSDNNNRARINFCRTLSKYKKIDCYGSVLKNTEFPPELLPKYQKHHRFERNTHSPVVSMRWVNKMNQKLFQDYKFVICFENSCAKDYITEKLPNALIGGAIPIYKGAPNVGHFFNTNRFINHDDYENYQAMIDKVIELDQDDDKYLAVVSQPSFEDDTVPQRVVLAKKDLEQFLDNVFKFD